MACLEQERIWQAALAAQQQQEVEQSQGPENEEAEEAMDDDCAEQEAEGESQEAIDIVSSNAEEDMEETTTSEKYMFLEHVRAVAQSWALKLSDERMLACLVRTIEAFVTEVTIFLSRSTEMDREAVEPFVKKIREEYKELHAATLPFLTEPVEDFVIHEEESTCKRRRRRNKGPG